MGVLWVSDKRDTGAEWPHRCALRLYADGQLRQAGPPHIQYNLESKEKKCSFKQIKTGLGRWLRQESEVLDKGEGQS